ncbi:unnamed protein product [Gadus morhua 'NCC']
MLHKSFICPSLVFVSASQSAAAVNNIALLSSAMVSLSADREAYGIFRARKRAHGTSP